MVSGEVVPVRSRPQQLLQMTTDTSSLTSEDDFLHNVVVPMITNLKFSASCVVILLVILGWLVAMES